MENNNGIKNIIFDLGGVILNIDMKKTEQAFVELGIRNFGELYNQFHATDLFSRLETGIVSPDQFVEELARHTDGVSADKIIAAWNALLLDFPANRILLLQKLKKKYRTFLLSNTNRIHHDAFQRIFKNVAGIESSLDDCFEKAYYSHNIRLRKPGKEIFEWILNENKLVPEETLFVDDTLSNVEAANSVNIRGFYLKPPQTIEEAFANY